MGKKEKAPTHGPEYEEFGRNLTKARKKLGLSQADIAKQLNMNQSTYAGYETGTRKVPLSVIITLSDYFKIGPDELISSHHHTNENIFPLSEFEKEIIEAYRHSDYIDKETIHRILGLSNSDISKRDTSATA